MVKFVKSFSNGQITIPKEFREKLGLSDDFWLKISEEGSKLVIEPVPTEHGTTNYAQKLLDLSGDWFDIKEYKTTRAEVEKRLKKNDERASG